MKIYIPHSNAGLIEIPSVTSIKSQTIQFTTIDETGKLSKTLQRQIELQYNHLPPELGRGYFDVDIYPTDIDLYRVPHRASGCYIESVSWEDIDALSSAVTVTIKFNNIHPLSTEEMILSVMSESDYEATMDYLIQEDPSVIAAKELFSKMTKEDFESDMEYLKQLNGNKMNKYRKTATVTAEQFLPLENKIPSGVISSGLGDPRKRSDLDWVIDTLAGRMTVQNTDWICTGIDGEKWAINDDIFKRTYELVDGSEKTIDDYKTAINVVTQTSNEAINQYTRAISFAVSEINHYIKTNKTADGVRALFELKDSLVTYNSTFKRFFEDVK